MQIIFHYSEIALKKGNRSFYEQILRQNIVNSLKQNCNIQASVVIKQSTGFIKGDLDQNFDCVFKVLLLTPGIAWFGIKYDSLPIDILINKSYDSLIYDKIRELLGFHFIKTNNHLDINVLRKNKLIKLTSQDIWIALRRLQQSDKYRHTDNYKLRDFIKKNIGQLQSLQIIIGEESIDIYIRFNGVFGLPVGATGKGIVLFSGGIDSPVSAFVAAKRGISLDLLHFSPYSADEIKQTKIYEIYKKLRIINPYARLFVANVPFLKQAKISSEIIAGLYNPMIVFKRIIAKVACLLGAKLYKNEFVVISGDSLGQVSSQTISNLVAVNKAFYSTKIKQSNNKITIVEDSCLNRAIFIRPLSGMNKDEIINLAKQIGTYDLSIKDYIDCCSVLAKTSKTSTNLEKMQKQDKDLNMEEIVKQALGTVQKVG